MSRVLMLTTSPERRGAELFAVALSRALSEEGVACTLLAVRPTETPNPLDLAVAGRGRWDPAGLARLTRVARDHDVVVGHGSVTLLAGSLAATGARRPFVYRSIGDPASWGRVRLAGVRVGSPLRRAAAVVALYDGARDELVRRYGLRPGRVHTVPNAVDADRVVPVDDRGRAAARARAGLDPDLHWVGSLGSLTEEKQPELAVRAVAQDPTLGLLMAGDGPLRTRCEGLADRLAPGRVRFLGSVTDPAEVLDPIEALVLPSRTEGIPAAAIEAGLAGLPVVAFRVGGLGDVVEDRSTGRLLPLPSAATPPEVTSGALADALRDVVATREALGARARERCLARYAMPVVAAQWAEVIGGVLNGGGDGRARPET